MHIPEIKDAKTTMRSGRLHSEDSDTGRKVVYIVPSKQIGELPVKLYIAGWYGRTAATCRSNGRAEPLVGEQQAD